MTFLLFIFGMNTFSFGQDYSLTIKVTSQESENPLSGVTITISPCDCGGITNLNGIFTKKLKKDNYSLNIDYLGYGSKNFVVDLNSNKTLTIRMEVKEEELSEVVILAQKRNKNIETYIQTDDPALFITHGSNDATVPVTKAYELSNRAASIQLPHQMYIINNAGHGYDLNTVIDSSGETVFLRMLGFLYQHVILDEDANLVIPSLGITSLALLAIFLIYLQRQQSDQLN